MTQTLDPSALALSPMDVAARLLCAMFIGLVVGAEREYTHRPAGMRTHMLVSLGACIVMMTSQMIFAQYRPYGATPDPARLSAQVITGIGFLGAGTILREGVSVKGLTTAASLWMTACMGVAAGGGYYVVALAGFVSALVTLVLFEQLQKLIIKGRYSLYDFKMTCENAVATMELIRHLADEQRAAVTRIHIEGRKGDKPEIRFRANFSGANSLDRVQNFFSALQQNELILYVTLDRQWI